MYVIHRILMSLLILHRLCFILSASAPFILLQFYFLHTLTSDGKATEGLGLGTTRQTSTFDTKPSQESVDPVEDDQPIPFSWSACLLIKDSNVLLPEWLAYHYTVLPLRRLIVAVDPSSNDDPQSILDQYRTIGMDITVWRNETYLVDGLESEDRLFHPSQELLHSEKFKRFLNERLVERQTMFYTQCLRALKRENRTWTTLIDVDEYLAFNYYHPDEAKATWCQGNVTCEEEYLDTIRRGTHFRTKLNQSATAAEYIAKSVEQEVPSGVNPRLASVDYNFNIPNQPCIVLDRYLMNSKESDREEIQRDVDEGFDAANFQTISFRHRGIARPQKGKVIVDASRSTGEFMISPHRLYRDKGCTGGGPYAHNAAMSFRVHHYIGSWQTYRLRGARGRKDDFEKQNSYSRTVVDDTTQQYSSPARRTWLSQFVKLVGKEKALDLTQRMRIREELEVEKNLFQPKKFPGLVEKMTPEQSHEKGT